MVEIENYEQFCSAFCSEDEELRKEANLLLFIQNWIISILDCMKEDTLDYNLDKLIENKLNEKNGRSIQKDALSNIIDYSEAAFRHLTENMREKIIRENVQMPIYKVKEINSYGLNWLSRQSGKTIKQKVSSAGNSIMAVQRRMSFDTAENRLFIAFTRELLKQLDIKLKNMPEELIRKKEEELRDKLANFLRQADIEEIKRWENLPPNNTLLSDQNYKKIWFAWNEMKKLDDRLKNNKELIDNRLATIFFIGLLIHSHYILKIPQGPVEIEYDNYNVHLDNSIIQCLNQNGEIITLKKGRNYIETLFNEDKLIRAEFQNKNLILYIKGKKTGEYEITPNTLLNCIKLYLIKIGINLDQIVISSPKKNIDKYKDVIVDLFSLRPKYIGDEDSYKELAGRILQQKYTIKLDGDEKSYYIPCDQANAIKMISDITETYTIPYSIDKGSMEQMKRLMYMMEQYILTDTFTYIFPDAYNELQLSMIYKAAKMVYRKVKSIPLSIGVAFNYQTTINFKDNFKSGDFLLILNLIDDELTFTLVNGIYDKNIIKDIPEYKGIVWERHPTSTTSLKKLTEKIIDYLTKLGCVNSEKLYKLLALEGIKTETDQLSIFYGNEWFELKMELKEKIQELKFNITKEVTEFIAKNNSIIKDSKIHIISVIDNFIYKGNLPFIAMNKISILKGCKNLKKLECRTKIPLWHDHLPALAIKLMYGKFDLIKDARVEPKFDEKQRISINSTFTLPKQCKEYHFNLVQDENARKMQYEAVIKNPAFPLEQDVECDLIMTYQYGTEEPYELIFVPKNPEKAKFKEAKVKWFRLEGYAIDNLKSPDFPTKLTWEELKYYQGQKGEFINICKVLENEFELLSNGYQTLDISNTYQNKENTWGIYNYQISNENIQVLWTIKNWDKDFQIPTAISNISFWLIPILKKEQKRYYEHDLSSVSIKDDLWFINKNNDYYQCIVKIKYKSKISTILLSEQNFDMPDKFDPKINNVSFEIRQLMNGKLQAFNIHNEDGEIAPKRYRAVNICEGDKIPTPPTYFINSFYSKWTRILFSNNRSLFEKGCPEELQNSFIVAKNNWINLFYQYKNINDKKRIFTLLSLAANDLGKDYYDIAYSFLKIYKENNDVNLPFEIGCAFGDLSNDMQRELFEVVLKDVKEDYKIIGILSKAIWHDKEFIFNVNLDFILNNYLPKSIEHISKIIKQKDYNAQEGYTLKNLRDCLEFILGVLRLRSLNDKTINSKYLSLNNPKMQDLYRYLEIMIDENRRIHSFLKLEIQSKGSYNNICDLLYVLLVYVTGYNAEGEIRISGINVEEE